ncbi:MAG: MarR family winged helix-turn-helix transcriptional regulator [Vulcanimicrobiaceae bacterium]
MSSRWKNLQFVDYVRELHRAVHALGLFLESRLDNGLSQAEVLVVMHLAALEPSTINELHRAFLHRRSTLTSVVDRLESKGLLRRIAVQNDRRSVGIELTARGRRAGAEIASALAELQREAEGTSPVSEGDVARVRGIAESASLLSDPSQPPLHRKVPRASHVE